jgi:hypothetical protein
MAVDKDKKKKGRKSKDEYYKSKQPDNVQIENVIIMLPISLDDLNFDMNMDKQIEIFSGHPSELSPYTPEENMTYGEVKLNKDSKIISRVCENPIIIDSNLIEKVEIYDLTLNTDGVKSSISCWWCCHPFESEPVFMPTALNDKGYKVNGVFCSYSCCYTYMKLDPVSRQKLYLLNFMFRDETGKKGVILDHITPAPDRSVLQMFGGPMSITEFRTSPILKVNKYPMTYIKTTVEKTVKTKPQQVYKVLPPSKKYKPTKVEIPNNSLSKILGISLNNEI